MHTHCVSCPLQSTLPPPPPPHTHASRQHLLLNPLPPSPAAAAVASPPSPVLTSPPGVTPSPTPPATETMDPPVPVSGLPYTISVVSTGPSTKQVVPYCLVDGPNTYMYCPDGGNGTTLPEQFTIYTPNMDNAQVINDGESFIIRSKITNRWAVVCYSLVMHVNREAGALRGVIWL